MNSIFIDNEGKIHEVPYIYYDEISKLPDYKWYRNPIKWYKWRKMMNSITRKIYNCKFVWTETTKK